MARRWLGVWAGLAVTAAWLVGGTAPVPAAAPKLYVGLFRDDAVAVIDTGSNRVTARIPVPKGPHGLVITPDGRKVYVSSDSASTVSVIDTASDRVTGSVDVGPNPHGLAVSADGTRVLVSGWGSNEAVLIDTGSDRVVARVPVPQPHNAAFAPDGTTAYVASQAQGATALVIVDLAGSRLAGTVALAKTPRALDVSPDGTRVYFTVAGTDAILVLDTATRKVAGQIAVGASPHYAPFTRDGRLALAASQGPGELGVLDARTNTVAATVQVGKTPHWVTASADGRTAYVTNEGSNDVSVVDVASRRVIATIPVGNAPRKIAVQAGSGQAAAPGSGAPGPVASAARSVLRGGMTFVDHGTRDVRGQASLHLEADDYYFSPTFLRGTPGQKLRLLVESESGTLHNVSIPAQKIDRDIPPHGKAMVEVTFPASGVVRLFCKVHTALGMNGELMAADSPAQ